MSGQQIVTSSDAFGLFKVQELYEGDFWIGKSAETGLPYDTPTKLRSTKCHIILFYDQFTDPLLFDIWARLAQAIGGPIIAGLNTTARKEVMDAFAWTNSQIDHPLRDFVINGTPTILVYRMGWPQAYYNGELSFDALRKWILQLACKPGYREPDLTFTGVAAVEAEEFVPDVRIENFAWPTSSRDYTAFTGEIGPRGGEQAQVFQDQIGVTEEVIQPELITEQVGTVTEQIQNIGFFDESQYQ